MGNWNINIQGTGAHHNRNANGERWNETDADLMAQKFVEDLRAAGHQVEGATFTHGCKQDLSKTEEKSGTSSPPG